MNKFLFLSITVFIFIISACQPTTKEAIEYNDGIIVQHNLVQEKFSLLNTTYDTYVDEEMDFAYNEALQQLNEGINFVNSLEGFEQDAYFKQAAINFLDTFKEVLENDHKRIIELYKLPEKEYGDKEVAELEKLRDHSNIKLDKAINDMLVEQRKFAKKYKIQLNQSAN